MQSAPHFYPDHSDREELSLGPLLPLRKDGNLCITTVARGTLRRPSDGRFLITSTVGGYFNDRNSSRQPRLLGPCYKETDER
jgi:hypothetical protein